jgi:hypothetical protein
MNKRICIAVMDSANTSSVRISNSSRYASKAQKTEEEKCAIMEEQMADGGWPRDEDEDVDLTNFNNIVDQVSKNDEFKIGYLTIPEDIGKPFFNNPATQAMFAKYNPRIINKAEYQQIIEIMRKMIVDQCYKVLSDRHSWQGALESRLERWESPHEFPYDLDNKETKITNAYTAEIQIWDLIRMYKTIDWMRNDVVVYYL